MGTPVIRGVAADAWSAHTSGRSVTLPASTQAGDVVLAFPSCDYGGSGDASLAGSGWQLIVASSGGANAFESAYRLDVTSGGSQDVTLSSDSSSETALSCLVLDGSTVDSVDASAATEGSDNGKTQTALSVTATGSDDLLICGYVYGDGRSGSGYTPPSGMTQDTQPTDGQYVTQLVCHEALTASGATGTRTATAGGSSQYSAGWCAISVAVKGAGTGSTNATLSAGTAAATASASAAMLAGTVHVDGMLAAQVAAGAATALSASLTGATHIDAMFAAGLASATSSAYPAALAGTVHLNATLAAGLATASATAHLAALTGGSHLPGTLTAATATTTAAAHEATLTGETRISGSLDAATATASGTAYPAVFDTPNAVAYPAMFTATANAEMATATGTATAHPAALTGTSAGGPSYEYSDDFESGTISGWDNTTSVVTATADAAHGGSYGMRQAPDGSTAGIASLSNAMVPDGLRRAHLEFWWRQVDHTSGNSPVVTVQNRTGADHADLYVNYGADGHLWWDLVGTDNAETPGLVADGAWRFIEADVDFGSDPWTLRVSLDGVQQSMVTSPGKPASDVRAIHFGGFGSEVNTRDYDDIDVELYDSPLPPLVRDITLTASLEPAWTINPATVNATTAAAPARNPITAGSPARSSWTAGPVYIQH
ncbi:MAG: hypothetical protein ACRDMV_03835 [Streptosporangiales bacterium]